MQGKLQNIASSRATETPTQRSSFGTDLLVWMRLLITRKGCLTICIILGNRVFIIHCASSLKYIQASGKSKGFWSDPTSNSAFEAPTWWIWQVEAITRWSPCTSGLTGEKNILSLTPAKATLSTSHQKVLISQTKRVLWDHTPQRVHCLPGAGRSYLKSLLSPISSSPSCLSFTSVTNLLVPSGGNRRFPSLTGEITESISYAVFI